jgi:hypothetical protein
LRELENCGPEVGRSGRGHVEDHAVLGYATDHELFGIPQGDAPQGFLINVAALD